MRSLPGSRRTAARTLLASVAVLALVSACVSAPAADLEAGDVGQPPSSSSSPASASSPTSRPPRSTATPPSGGPWIASLGDSFISGEAGRWAGNSYGSSTLIDALGPTAYFDAPNGKSELIPLCHRSKSAMVHIGDDGGPNGGGDPVGSTNLACSGAETRTFTEDGAFKPGLDFVGQGTARQGQAAMLQDLAAQHDVAMVLVSIGGNDFGFADVIEDCLEDFLEDADYCSDDSSVTNRIAPAAVQKITGRITQALRNVRQAMRQAGKQDGSWTLVVNLNPDTLALGGDFRYPSSGYSRWYDGGCGFYDRDATWAGTKFVVAVRAAAAAALQASGVSGGVLLDWSRVLDQRELCVNGTEQVGDTEDDGPASWQAAGAVDGSEWGNEIRVKNSGPYFEQESLHPNYWAQLAARSCVRQLYAQTTKVNSTCTRTGTGLTSRGEPVVTLTPSG